ncbi:MAG: glucose-6-phosphate isomerase [Spirochaetia bacterium]|nr:glucose-6-phosphate isomerase [Spirochaetia bacterium]
MDLSYKNLTEATAFAQLAEEQSVSLKEQFNSPAAPERIAAYQIPMAGGLTYSYAAMPVSDSILTALQALADEQQLIEKYRRLLDGDRINTGENRAVLHHLTRGKLGRDVVLDDEDKREFYLGELERIDDFSRKVHNGTITGSTGKQLTTVVQIGIGGSDLGPRALCLALDGHASAQPNGRKMDAHFISNVDPDDAAAVLSRIDFERTLFILVSKSGTTQETLTNQDLVLRSIAGSGIPDIDPARHMVAVTSKTSPLAASSDYLASFYIDDYIGGRYSSTSAVGGLVISLAYGSGTFKKLLSGAAAADEAALKPDITENAALADAMIGIYLRNISGCRTTAVLPYSQALSRFAAHLQQLDMESNGKRVNRSGKPIDYQTGPIIFGEPGTNGQHSFYQLLHQGTDIIPLQFIGFAASQYGKDAETGGSTSQEKLNANLTAQIVAFARGKDDADPNKQFPGERPSSLIFGSRLTPEALGALLAHFENKVMFQGFCWNINSFDQEGVQLGKVLTGQVLSGAGDGPLSAFYALLQQGG